MRLLFYTDIHARTEWEVPEAMASAAKMMNAERADLAICGGDCITDGFQSARATVAPRWAAYHEQLHSQLSLRILPAIGNHDLVGALPEDGSEAEPDPRAPFRQELDLARTYYTAPAGGYHVIVLDSIEVTGGPFKYRGFIDATQLSWLREELTKVEADTPIILMTHIPLLTSFYQAVEGHEKPAPPNRVVVNNREVLDCFAEHRLHVVLQGHLHVNEMMRWRRTTFITGGAVCGKWWRGEWQGTDAGYGVLTLRRDRVDWDYKETGWEPRRP